MRRPRRSLNDNENLDRWLLTYADLITLLLAFFVVMYSMSQVDAKKFGQIQEALHGKLKGGPSLLKHPDPKADVGHGLLKLGKLDMIQAKIQEKFKGLNMKGVETEITERGLVIHVMESILFESGSATLQPQALDVLNQIADIVRLLPNHIRIEGHTDDRIIETPVFPSNWELSTARAT
jgi:chemotaxis protein MotB